MDKTLTLRAHVEGADAMLCLNRLPLARIRDGQELKLAVHEYLMAGENQIELQSLAKVDMCAHAIRAQLNIEIQKDRGSKVITTPTSLHTVEQLIQPRERLPQQQILNALVSLPVKFPRWRFFDLMDAFAEHNDKLRLEDFVSDLLGSIEKKRVMEITPLFIARNKELALAYGLDASVLHRLFCDSLLFNVESGSLAAGCSDPEQWQFRRVGQSSMYALLNQDHEPLFQFHDPESNTVHRWPMLVAVLTGDVFVIR